MTTSLPLKRVERVKPEVAGPVVSKMNQDKKLRKGSALGRRITPMPSWACGAMCDGTSMDHEEVDGDGASVQACKYTHICTYIYNYIFTYIYIYIEGERDSHTIYTYIAGWKRLETLNLVSQSPNLCLNKCFYNLTSGLEGICV